MLQIQQSEVNIDRLRKYYAAKGYTFFEDGDFNLNIIGIRNRVPVVNQFCDAITCAWKEGGNWKQAIWAATTDPGIYWMENPMVPEGCAILIPNQYRGSHAIGTHHTYTALVQVGKLDVWRDSNRNDVLDYDKSKVYSGNDFGINIHHASADFVQGTVDMASAGCQVFQDIKDFNAFMALVFKSSTMWGSVFSYTLVDQADLSKVVPA